MNKSTKGALAAGSAAVLLLGGAGSLAYWTADATVSGTKITAGELKLGTGTCDGWKLAGASFDTATEKVVPGDVLTQICNFPIKATGKRLSADLVATAPTVNDSKVLVNATYKVGTETKSVITSADDGKNLTATVTVELPYGTTADNTTQGIDQVLSNFTISAKQKQP